MLKNRESASLSRRRKKEHNDLLEQKVTDIQLENANLLERLANLEAENKYLRGNNEEVVEYIRKIVNS